jgi:hypothetical protein
MAQVPYGPPKPVSLRRSRIEPGLLTLRVLLLCMFGLATSRSNAVDSAGSFEAEVWEQRRGLTVQIDNDLFAAPNRDRDYTGGLSISAARFGPASVWNPERWLGGLTRTKSPAQSVRALQFQLIAFAPGILSEREPQPRERPYASLWAVSVARQSVTLGGDRAVFASLTAGLLGLRATETVHRSLHKASDTELPEGYEHQISQGGEPTFKLTLADRRLLTGGGIGAGTDIWLSFIGSAGYLTQGSVAVAARWGDRGTPWWASSPELADYAPAPDFAIAPRGGERTVDAGLRLSARAWNAFLQGQFRHSDVRIDLSDANPLVATAWIGVTIATPSGSRFSYRLTAQSPELRSGPASRAHFWGSLIWTRAF